jgi:phosphatidylserine/phosphatidylglycerophosphate/cardiolipin synthase-like enzyme
VQLIIQPDAGLTPLLKAVRGAKKSIDLVIFRFNRTELEKALGAAVARGVVVRALIAHTNQGGEKALRKLEMRLLEAGVTVSRTADDLPRYHGKMTIVDGRVYVLGFNYTKQDIEKSRSFGIATTDARIVKEAQALFEADVTRQPYTPGHDQFVVSPEASREKLANLIRGARKELLIYDDRVSDRLMLRLLRERAAAGVEIRIIGRIAKPVEGVTARKLADLRLHVRTIICDGARAFVGSQSLRKLELDSRREVGVIVKDAKIVKQMRDVFEADWALSADKKDKKESEDADAKDKAAKDQAEKDKAAKDKADKDKADKEKSEKDKADKEKAEKDEKDKKVAATA